MSAGIDKIAFFTSPYFIDMTDLANARGEDPNKYLIGIGQQKQAVIPPTQDVVTLAANAASSILTPADKASIDMVILGTESGIDNSKAAAIYVQSLLGISKRARSFEVKQACYGGTAGIQMGMDHLRSHPTSKVLVIASDIARYGLNTPGEVTQGGGAVAMLLTADPRILVIEDKTAFHSDNIMDFWRPLYRREALVDGHYSNNVYVDFFNQTWRDYQNRYQLAIDDFNALIFHLPYPKMGLKALRSIVHESHHPTQLMAAFDAAKTYNSQVGNLYTGSLYLSLLSLLANDTMLKPHDRIGLFSYGSGAQGEFYSARIGDGVKPDDLRQQLNSQLNNRQQLTIAEYEALYETSLPLDGGDRTFDTRTDHSPYILKGRIDNRRQYEYQNGETGSKKEQPAK